MKTLKEQIAESLINEKIDPNLQREKLLNQLNQFGSAQVQA